MTGERLPSLPLPQPQATYSSGTSSPRVSSIASSISSHSGSQSSFTSAASSNGPKTPSPTLPLNPSYHSSSTQSGPQFDHYPNMNQSDMYYPQHISAGQAPPPQTVTSGTMSHYPQHQPGPLLQPGPASYQPPPPYSQYGYANGLTSPPSAAPTVSNPMNPAQNVLPLPGVQQGMQNQYHGFDQTGQVAPPGMKPRVTATLWEDEGSLCFQVEARGICVARREDNHMINGTKLLNVAGMTRGRRDGILKSEKVRHVVKIGPMHLKGVWIPFERALDFANKEKITELLYPLFVHNIGALLYHPTNQTRTNQVMQAAERRKQEGHVRNSQPPPTGLPSIGQHHHHTMALPGPQSSLPSHGSMARPGLDRAHTFPTPPTSASSMIGGSVGAPDGFQWAQSQGMSGAQATTPPGNNIQSMQTYSNGNQSYDGTRQLYSSATTATQQPSYSSSAAPQDRSLYGAPTPYVKNEMAPPATRPEQQDNKAPNGIIHHDQNGGQHAPHPAGEDEADHEHDAEYTHDSGAYDTNRTSYNYSSQSVGTLAGDHSHLSPEMTGSPSHQAGSGRATPRTAPPPQPYYTQQGGYTPPRAQQPPSNLYNVMTNDRGTANGTPGSDPYASQTDMSTSMTNGYAASQPPMNGAGSGLKRGREEDDEVPRPSSGGPGVGGVDLKRRKTMMESTLNAPAYDTMSRPTSAVAAQRRR